MAAGDGKSPLISVWLNAQTDLLRAKVNFGDADTTEASVFTNWYLGTNNIVLSADAGSYSITGSAATFFIARALFAESGAYNLIGLPANLIRSFLYPDPGDVRDGVIYGPGGIFTGTLVATSGETSVAIRSFTRKF